MKFKRVLASFLSAAMVLTCAPVPAWQAGIVNAEDVAEAGSTQEELQKKLDQAKADAKARLDRGTYTESSKTKLEQAMENADAIFADASAGNEAKQEAIDAIVSAAEDLQRQWTVKAWLDGVTVSADSAEDGTGAACDGNVNTCYQSNYSGVNEVEYAVDEDGNAVYMTKNNNIYLKLSKATTIAGVSYVPRIDSSGNLTQEGAITQASIYISKDNGATYTPEMENLVIEYAKADGTPWNYYTNGAIKIPFENQEENVTNVKIEVQKTASIDDPSKANKYINVAEIGALYEKTMVDEREKIAAPGLSVTAPAAGETPLPAKITSEGVEQNYVLTSTKWTDADGKEVTTFQKGVDYTVTITLTAKEGYKFTSPTSIPNVIVGDEKLSVSTSVRDSVTGQTSEMTVLYTFQADGTGTNTGGNSQGTGGDQIDEEETIPAPSITYISPTAGKSPKKASVTNDISPAPYDVKTTWTTTKDGKALDSTDTFKEDTEYTVTTVFTAHDGYIFTADSVNKEYITVGNLAGIKTDAKLAVKIPEGGKTMTVSVSYGETSELTCTCKISDIQLADQTITLEANESVRTLQIRPSTKISSSCPVEGHPKEVSWNYAVKEGEDVISISDQGLITTKKTGEAVITITATLPRRDDEEPAVSSADVKITVKSKRAEEADVTNLENAVADAKEKINGVKEDLYTADSVETLKAAIAEAEELLAKKPVISAEDVQAALEKIERAKLVEKGSETPGTDTTPGKDETPGTDATPGKDETPSTDATPGKNDTPTTDLTPGKDNTSGTGDSSNKAGGTGSQTPQAKKVVAGQTYDSGDYYYKVISTADKTVQVSGLKNVDLKKITIYSSVVIGGESYKVIGVTANAFKNNKKITAVTIKKNAVSIGSSAFAGCTSLKKVTVKGSTLKTIGAKAFSGCKNLKAISLKPDKALKSVGKNAFKGISKKAVIKVPAAKRAAYKKLLAKKGQAGSVKIK